MNTKSYRLRSAHGGILISALVFTVITALMLTGMATISVSYYARAHTEADYNTALNLAEAGVNYEFWKISANAANADQRPNGTSPGVAYSFGGGNFYVYCCNQDGSTPWTAPNKMYVNCTGVINGVSRTVQVSGKSYSVTPDYALFGVAQGIMNGTPTTVGGDVGTNGFFTFNGHPTISGSVNFNGPGSNWQSPPNGSYTVNYLPNPIVWPTVSAIASQTVPGGLAAIAAANDNALAVPPIVGNSVLINGNGTLTLKGKPGGANYYVTSLIMNGNANVAFDNSNGPINIWQGPAGASGSFIFNGGSSAIKNSADPTKNVHVYIASNNDVILNGNTRLDAGIYNYNGPSSGRVIFNGTPDVYGSVISNMFTANGNPTIYYRQGYFQASTAGYYGFDTQWLEQNPYQ